MSDPRGLIDAVLACPTCVETPLRAFPYDKYGCAMAQEEGPKAHFSTTLGVPNLLPFQTRDVECLPEEEFKVAFAYRNESGAEFAIGSEVVWGLLDNIHHGYMREVSNDIRTLVEQLPYEGGRLRNESVTFFSLACSALFNQHYKSMCAASPESIPTFLEAFSLARYEAELQCMGDYPGNFVLPSRIVDLLPEKGVIAEIGMGNGATLRSIHGRRNPAALLGFDNCYGMVDAARRLVPTGVGRTFFQAMADAHYLPLLADSVDGIVMLNALDRLADPQRVLGHIGRVVKDGGVVVLGNCMPLQYDIEVRVNGGVEKIRLIPEEMQFASVDKAIDTIPGAEIIGEERRVKWHPETITQGRETLFVDVVAASIRK